VEKNYELDVRYIGTHNDLLVYNSLIAFFGNNNPYYCLELLNKSDFENFESEQLCYFHFSVNEKLVIMMPFFKRNISSTNLSTNYYDIISPYGYSGPLYDSEVIPEEVLKEFWLSVDLWYKKENIVSEFLRFSLNENTAGYTGKLIPSLKNVKGKIIDHDQQWDQFKAKVRNNYRKAVQEDLKLKIYTKENINQEVIDLFYDIYITTMQRNNAHTVYFYDKDYFNNFINKNPNSYAIALVYKDGKAISTELILIYQDTLYSFLGGTNADYFHTRPNDFLKIEVLNWGRKNNFDYYSLGGGRSDGDNLYKYKKTFFPKDEDVTFYTGRKIINLEILNYHSFLIIEKTNKLKSILIK